jgi:hypothetical protein
VNGGDVVTARSEWALGGPARLRQRWGCAEIQRTRREDASDLAHPGKGWQQWWLRRLLQRVWDLFNLQMRKSGGRSELSQSTMDREKQGMAEWLTAADNRAVRRWTSGVAPLLKGEQLKGATRPVGAVLSLGRVEKHWCTWPVGARACRRLSRGWV